jgi:hypothetical protein
MVGWSSCLEKKIGECRWSRLPPLAVKPEAGVMIPLAAIYRFGFAAGVLGRRRIPPRNSKCVSFNIASMEAARPSQGTRANWRAESHATLYQTFGFSPGYR